MLLCAAWVAWGGVHRSLLTHLRITHIIIARRASALLRATLHEWAKHAFHSRALRHSQRRAAALVGRRWGGLLRGAWEGWAGGHRVAVLRLRGARRLLHKVATRALRSAIEAWAAMRRERAALAVRGGSMQERRRVTHVRVALRAWMLRLQLKKEVLHRGRCLAGLAGRARLREAIGGWKAVVGHQGRARNVIRSAPYFDDFDDFQLINRIVGVSPCHPQARTGVVWPLQTYE